MLNIAQNDRKVSQFKVLGNFMYFYRVYIENFHIYLEKIAFLKIPFKLGYKVI